MKEILIFVAGAAIGSAVTYLAVKDKYRKIAQEEIDCMKEHYAEKKKDVKQEVEEEEDFENYKHVVDVTYSQGPVIEVVKEPYPITQEQYDESRLDFDKVCISYYDGDGTLADDDIIFHDLEHRIGLNNLKLFDEEDVIYIRNESAGTDYEVVCEHMAYEDRYPQDFEDE